MDVVSRHVCVWWGLSSNHSPRFGRQFCLFRFHLQPHRLMVVISEVAYHSLPAPGRAEARRPARADPVAEKARRAPPLTRLSLPTKPSQDCGFRSLRGQNLVQLNKNSEWFGSRRRGRQSWLAGWALSLGQGWTHATHRPNCMARPCLVRQC